MGYIYNPLFIGIKWVKQHHFLVNYRPFLRILQWKITLVSLPSWSLTPWKINCRSPKVMEVEGKWFSFWIGRFFMMLPKKSQPPKRNSLIFRCKLVKGMMMNDDIYDNPKQKHIIKPTNTSRLLKISISSSNHVGNCWSQRCCFFWIARTNNCLQREIRCSSWSPIFVSDEWWCHQSETLHLYINIPLGK